MASSKTGFASLEPAYILKLDICDINPVGPLSTGETVVHVTLPTGSISTVEGFEPKLDAQVAYSADALRFDPDGQRARINVDGLVKTAEGTPIIFKYYGVGNMSPGIKAVFDLSPDAKTTPFGQVTVHNSFEVGDPRYKVLENSVWVGNCRFVVDNGKVTVETRVSKVISSTDAD